MKKKNLPKLTTMMMIGNRTRNRSRTNLTVRMMKWNDCVKKPSVSTQQIVFTVGLSGPDTIASVVSWFNLFRTGFGKKFLGSKNTSRRRHSSSRSSRSDRDRRRTRRDSCESRSNSDDDALTEMRRKLLADRAQRKPNDLRARLARGKKISAFINPNLSPKQPVTIKDQDNNQMQFPNFKVGRTVLNNGSKTVPERKRFIVSICYSDAGDTTVLVLKLS